MKKSLLLLLIIGFQLNLFSQRIQIKSYEFISNSRDTVIAELGTFKVLENRTNGIKDSIQLSFVRFKSTNPNPGSPIVYLSGGPGGSGIGTAQGNRFELFMKLREVADVIAFDQRGTGMSNVLPKCPYEIDLVIANPTSKEEYLKKTTNHLKKCIDFWNKENNLNAYNTNENAKDLEELRRVLKADKISLWGISYGSHLAFEYIRLFEQNIDKVVLASLEGPNETIKLPTKTDSFIDELCNRAKDNYGFEPKYPDLKNKILAVHNQVKENTIRITYTNKKGLTDTIGISNFELQLIVASFYLKNPNDSKKLPKLYSKMYNGDFSDIAPYIKLIGPYLSRIQPMSLSMDMQSGISKKRKQIVKNQTDNAILGSAINFLLYEWMDTLGFGQLSNEFRTLNKNSVDALLLSGTLDGRTYLSSAKEIAKSFQNGQHIIIDNAGHDLYMSSPLVGDLVLDFFKGKKLNIKSITLKPTPFE